MATSMRTFVHPARCIKRFLSSSSFVTSYKQMRLNELRSGDLAYPNTYIPSHTPIEMREQFEAQLKPGGRLEQKITIVGRVSSKRDASSKLIFIDLVDGGQRMQVMASKANFNDRHDDWQTMHTIRISDIIAVEGIPGKTNIGELSVIARCVHILAPCFYEVPEVLTSPEARHRHRYLDMLINKKAILTIEVRAKILSCMRSFFERHQFVEVETPILWPSHGGASARPFCTKSVAFGQHVPLYMRIAPELFLKTLVIGGLKRVFEIGKVFRNEGIDHIHNPEFTSCEFYMAFASMRDLIPFTENMLREIVQAVAGVSRITCNSDDGPIDIDFSKPFKVLDIVPELEARTGSKFENINDACSLPLLERLCEAVGRLPSQPYNNGRLIDRLIEYYLEPLCIQPTFLIGHPECLSPLARSDSSRPGLTERFELFIFQRELVNAYSELNDPAEQRRRMILQSQALGAGDHDAQPLDENYCTALEHGLPPTAGWGMGIDRLVMMLANTHSIRDVLTFPVMRPDA